MIETLLAIMLVPFAAVAALFTVALGVAVVKAVVDKFKKS